MCGIFGYFSRAPITTSIVIKILQELEVSQYDGEENPVGGHGAGIAIIKESIEILRRGKIERIIDNPVSALRDIAGDQEYYKILGHVRHASNVFNDTISSEKCTQPYVANCFGKYQIISVHNGMFSNYKNVITEIGPQHRYESENIKLIDSEVIPHYFEYILSNKQDINISAQTLLDKIEGSGNAIALYLLNGEVKKLILLYKGKARGLYVWTNSEGDIIFCSRKEPIKNNIISIIRKYGYKLIKEITYQQTANYIQIFDITHITP